MIENLILSGFLDTYYAYDFNNPDANERQYTTQPARHNEFNINLAYIGLEVKRDKSRGKLILQDGTSVIKNYGAEPLDGQNKNDVRTIYGIDSRHIQEGYAGIKLGDKSWLDMGIFLGNIGMESWISKYNYTYTRSLMLDYVPYYSSGARLSHELDSKNSFQIQLLNSWQTVQENNQGKALGFQWQHTLMPKVTFTYNNFIGEDNTSTKDARLKTYHNFIIHNQTNSEYEWIGCVDVGTQKEQDNKTTVAWWNTAWTLQKKLAEHNSLAFRAEVYQDPHGANVTNATNAANYKFMVYGESITYNHKIDEMTLWRVEARHQHADTPIFPAQRGHLNKNTGFIVNSIALSF